MRFHCQTAGSTLTAQQPNNNVVRVAIQALAAILGGAQSLHTNSRDEALALPSEESVQLALRTQQIIAHESAVPNTVDPLAGSYALEALSNDLEKRANAYLRKIEALGGVLNAIEQGYIQREIQESAYRAQQAIEKKDNVIVGVNHFATSHEEKPIHLLKVDPIMEQKQRDKLDKLKTTRDPQRVASTLSQLKNAAKGTENLVPAILNAVKALATLGEISDTLREVFGVYREVKTI